MRGVVADVGEGADAGEGDEVGGVVGSEPGEDVNPHGKPSVELGGVGLGDDVGDVVMPDQRREERHRHRPRRRVEQRPQERGAKAPRRRCLLR